MSARVLVAFALILLASTRAAALDWFGNDFNGAACRGQGQAFGPYDFFDVDEPSDPQYKEGRWWEVRLIHAEPGKAAMQAQPFDQIAYNRAAAEFDYVLRAFPNHPDILYSRIMLEMKRAATPGLKAYVTPPECYLQRAEVFRPQQPHVYQLYAMYLGMLGKTDQAVEYYQRALVLDSKSAELNYNLGLAYFEKKDYGQALRYAREAYALGFPLPGLRNKLRAAGVWTDGAAQKQGSPNGEQP